MENTDFNQKTGSRNPENWGLVDYWREILGEKSREFSLYAPTGEPLRTFLEIEEEARKWSERLVVNGSGSVVAIQTGNIAEWPALVLGTWYAGRIVLPLDSDLAPDRRAEVERLCGVTTRMEIGAAGLQMANLDNSVIDWPEPRPVLLKLTSGTSAAPRVVRFTSAQLVADCLAVCETMGLRAGDRNYGVISFAHSYGFSNLITPLLCRGIPLVVAGDMIPQAVRGGLAASKATVFPGVPALFRALSGLEPGNLELRLCISAGAPLSREVAERFGEKWGRKVHTFYGSSECGGICYDAGTETSPREGYVGHPMRGVDIKPLSAKWPAQIEVQSAAVGEGYHPAQPDDELREGVFRPSDLLAATSEGYVITGRISDLINVSGRKVNPSEIERVLSRCPGVREVIVVGLPEGFRGEEVAACVVGETTEAVLRQFSGGILPAWQIPRRWVFVDSLPVNARGKISRAEIRGLF
ncbi:long-chain fatty acid--CoA ligase [soil metagenome]